MELLDVDRTGSWTWSTHIGSGFLAVIWSFQGRLDFRRHGGLEAFVIWRKAAGCLHRCLMESLTQG